MARGEVQQTKVQFNGKENDFVIFVDDANAVEEWKTDKSIPLVHVVKAFKIFVTQKSVTYPLSHSATPTINDQYSLSRLLSDLRLDLLLPQPIYARKNHEQRN